jgi:hypothetical protein
MTAEPPRVVVRRTVRPRGVRLAAAAFFGRALRPWRRLLAAIANPFVLELLDADGQPVMVPTTDKLDA